MHSSEVSDELIKGVIFESCGSCVTLNLSSLVERQCCSCQVQCLSSSNNLNLPNNSEFCNFFHLDMFTIIFHYFIRFDHSIIVCTWIKFFVYFTKFIFMSFQDSKISEKYRFCHVLPPLFVCGKELQDYSCDSYNEDIFKGRMMQHIK